MSKKDHDDVAPVSTVTPTPQAADKAGATAALQTCLKKLPITEGYLTDCIAFVAAAP